MALMESNMMALGTQAPEFSLPDTVSGKILNLAELRGAKATLVMFICNHCPYVIHVQDELAKLDQDFGTEGLSIIAISSNDVSRYPDDAPDKMKVFAEQNGFEFPYLYDESQEVAKAYDAACTPDFFMFDENLNLAYRGRLDESRPNSGIPVTGKDMRAAITKIFNGEAIPESEQYPSAGCSIKWK